MVEKRSVSKRKSEKLETSEKSFKMPRTSSNGWRNKKKSTCAVLGAFGLVVPFILLSYYVFGQTSRASTTLQLVSIVFRHGARTPTHVYPTDPYKDPKFWPDGFGALTKEGKQEMFRLGKILRERYGEFLGNVYSPEDVYVTSSDHDRCLMSAQVVLAGLYPPFGRQIWNAEINWQPIPVHTIPRDLDKLLVVKKPCPKYDKELNEIYAGNYFSKVNSDNEELYKYLAKHSGMVVENVLHLETLYNTLENEAKHNFKLPKWTDIVYNEKMKNLAALSLAAFTFTDETKRLKGGLLLKDVVEHTSQKVLGTLNPDRKLFLYSGHDLTLVSVLRALGFDELFKPDYGAALAFELHQPFDGGDHLVQVLYLNHTELSDPVKLRIPGCDLSCKLTDFLRITKPFIPKDWEAECQL